MDTIAGVNQPESPQELASRLSLPFGGDLSLLIRALTHRSYVNEHPETVEDNERLEFLGDAVLDFIVGAYLYNHFPEMKEGDLTKMRSSLVHTEQLARFARSIKLGGAMRLGHGETQAGGRDKNPILCDAFEALVGGIYLAGGLESVKQFIYPLIESKANLLQDRMSIQDPKSNLQEWSQARGLSTPVYETKRVSGPDHDREFQVDVIINGVVYGTGIGRSKQMAEKNAARLALENIDKHHYPDQGK